MRKIIHKCEYDGCCNDAKYALFQLLPNFTKKWVNVCAEHDEIIAQNSSNLKRLFPHNKWLEIK